jgi:two-component system response regulator CpxR
MHHDRHGVTTMSVERVRRPPTQATTPKHHSLLLIEDDRELSGLMQRYLSQHEYEIEAVYDGRQGLARAIAGKADAVILDLMIPELPGLEVLVQLRRRSSIPVIVLTALATPEARVAGLRAGADDYLCKPFAPEELLERVRAVLRRSGYLVPLASRKVIVGGISLDPATREVLRDGVSAALTSAEFDLLDILMRSAGRVVSREEISAVVYQRESTAYERTIDVHVSHLRKKLEREGELLIRAVRGVGYLFKAAE